MGEVISLVKKQMEKSGSLLYWIKLLDAQNRKLDHLDRLREQWKAKKGE